jgi:uncharacterized RDD family membrane protein YckC
MFAAVVLVWLASGVSIGLVDEPRSALTDLGLRTTLAQAESAQNTPVRPEPPEEAVVPQPPASPGAPVPPSQTPVEAPDVPEEARALDDVVRVGSDYTLGARNAIAELVVLMGSATVEGHVAGDLVVVLGEARLGPSAVVDGDVVVVGGSLRAAEGAVAQRDLVVIGGTIESPPSFEPGGEQVVVGFKALGDRVRGFLPWVTRGLLWARPIVPELPWVWSIVGALFLVYLGVLLVFEQPVRAVADSLAATPLRALLTGLAVLLLTGPIVLLLAVSVVGLFAIPFAVCALVIAGLVGRIASARWLGVRVVPEGEAAGRWAFVRSFTVGCAILVLAYMVPVLGGVVWAALGAAGLGAAVLAFVSAYQRENPPAVTPGMTAPPPFASSDASVLKPESFSPAAGPAGPSALALFPRASFTQRLAAFVLDAILVAIIVGLLDPIDGDAFVPLFLFYRSAFWAWKGGTVGGIICQLRVIRVDGSALGVGESLVRGLGSIFSVAVFGLGCLWMLRDTERQTWHDKMAGSCVVTVPRNWPL